MYRSLVRLRMASTQGGMRRILKNKGTVAKYIRQAVETGVYRTNQELETVRKERRESADDLRVIMRRFRQDIVRGTNIQDYPVEYLILRQHPPIPDPPKIPVKLARRMKEKPNPTQRLVEKYLNRQERKQSYTGSSSSSNSTAPHTTEEYYRRLLGVPAPTLDTAIGQKPAAVQKAYAAAVKHYQLQRTQGLSEQEALKQVDELLAQQNVAEQKQSKENAQKTQTFAQEMRASAIKDYYYNKDDDDDNASPESYSSALDSIFGDNPRTFDAMMRWHDRFEAVPYQEWTVGASVALDHWIARQLLGLSEETWQMLLEGDDVNLLSRGRDIVAAREALFPETIFEPSSPLERDDDEVDKEKKWTDSDWSQDRTKGEKSIEELLASLGGLKKPDSSLNDDDKEHDAWNWLGGDDEDDAKELDAKVDRLVVQLQEWRQKHSKSPYNDWTRDEQEKFGDWMKEYTTALVSETERGQVDLDATRKALLSQPPVSRDESEAFWSQLQEEGLAAQLLDTMRKDGPPPGASILHSAFWDLPFEQQLERLLNLGALRPVLDEYTSESNRIKFLQRHGDTLLEGVLMEHLIPDPNGPVRGSDLRGAVADELGVGGWVGETTRFRLEVQPYRSSDNMSAQERTRALYMAWNQQKAGRARYEEKMFQTGRLGLRYSDVIPDEDDESNEK